MNTAEPARAKFYGDMQQFITECSTEILFFELELNRHTRRLFKRGLHRKHFTQTFQALA